MFKRRSGMRKKIINVKQDAEVENVFKLLMLEKIRLPIVFYGFLAALHQPYVHTYKNVKDLVDIFSSDLNAIYLQYFISL